MIDIAQIRKIEGLDDDPALFYFGLRPAYDNVTTLADVEDLRPGEELRLVTVLYRECWNRVV
jgi:hypothetical protein